MPLRHFKNVWLADFEFDAKPGEHQRPVCVVAREFHTGEEIRLWQDQLGSRPPFDVGPDSLFVSYFATAELGCFLSLGWPMPVRVCDLYVEFRNLTNGCETVSDRSLLGALTHFGLDGIGSSEKNEMRELVLRGGPWTDEEKIRILDYCSADVDALRRLFPAMLKHIDFPRALLRGRYMSAVARMEYAGIPVNAPALAQLRESWDDIKVDLITKIDAHYGVFDGTTFKSERFER